MVTVVTVTTINAKAVHIVSLAGAIAKGNRGKTSRCIIVCLYPNDRAPIRKRSFDYTQIKTHSSTSNDSIRHNAGYGCSHNNPQAVSSKFSNRFLDEHKQGSFHPHLSLVWDEPHTTFHYSF